MNGRAYYNEFDPAAAAWLRNLIAEGLIPPGDVDTRSIIDVQPADLAGYKQCHFFAGVGGWGLAARLARWPDSRELWTGSAPCQPFSVAGKGKAQADDRHLWPHFFRLIRECRPAVVMGEQVAAAVGKGWLDGVCADLESSGYACEAAIVPACAVNAPHKRDRIWFVADAALQLSHRNQHERQERRTESADGRSALADTMRAERWPESEERHEQHGCDTRRNEAPGRHPIHRASALAYANESHSGEGRQQRSGKLGGTGGDPWTGADWIIGHDGKARRVEPSIRLLAHGISGRMAVQRTVEQGGAEITETHWYSRIAALRGFGNAIVPEIGAEVIGAYMDITEIET